MGNIQGLIRRRLLINYRVDPNVIERQLPSPFRPKLQRGYAVAGICLIRLEHIRPKLSPTVFGFNSEDATHRFSLSWEEKDGLEEGVYIPRRDTSSLINHLAGGRLFPGEHHRARFEVEEREDHIKFRMESVDRRVRVELSASLTSKIPPSSCFESL